MRARSTVRLRNGPSRAGALAAIPAEMRQILIMKECQGLTFREIAKILDIPVSTVKTRMYTGLRELRKRLEHVGPALSLPPSE
jgi:DNA-directed RNA polymerase specialized sigma24 family protein